MKTWNNIEPWTLKSIPEPIGRYTHTIEIPEFTFLGDAEQPDFGVLKIIMRPGAKAIELKSLKKYLLQYRDTRLSYERCINTLYDHLIHIYQPRYLYIELTLNPRGGISSTLDISSDNVGWLHE